MTDDERDKMIHDTHTTVSVLASEMRLHNKNTAIHQIPPCEFNRSLSARMWVCLISALGACVAAILK